MKNADEILNTLSVDEKIRLLNGVGSWDTFDANGKIPVISVSDGPHGLRHQTDSTTIDINDSNVATCFPTACAIASSWNVDATRKMADAIATEAKAENVQIVLGCGMNIKRSPLCGRNFEYFSEDPLLSGELASAFVQGIQNKNVGACLKHFAMNNQEKFRQTSSSNADERTMREIYLAGFERAVKKSQPHSIMCSYNKVNGVFLSKNKKLLTDILRDEWGFKGLVMSDWGANIDAVNSLKAGLDLGMPDSNGYFEEQLKAAYEKGELTQQDLDIACKRIINLALEYNEHKDEFAGGQKCEPVDFKNQHDIAFELACESSVLLKNDGFFPLKPQSPKQKILVVGELAQNMRFQGGGSSHINVAPYATAVEALKEYYDVEYVPGYISTFCKQSKKQKINEKRKAQAVAAINQVVSKNPRVPVLYFCGLEESYEGEGFDREDLKLPQSHIDLYKEIVKITKNIALITFSGSAIDMTFAPEAHAILHMYLCGQACGQACEALISGTKNPSGKLAETWPFKVEVGSPVNDLDVDYVEGTLVGYRWYETKNIPVQYEFGYGLSYTKFEYSDLKLNFESGPSSASRTATVTIKNIGPVDGSEIVQIYVKNPEHDLNYSWSCIELRAFSKVFLKAGEQKTVSFELDDRAFGVYSTKKNCFAIVGGEYQICAGSSVKDIRLSAPVKIKGEKLEELVRPDKEEQAGVFVKHPRHKKGEFTITDSLIEMSKESAYVRNLLKLFRLFIILTSQSKSKDDPAVKIGITGLEENPLESLISISNGRITEKMARKIVKSANR